MDNEELMKAYQALAQHYQRQGNSEIGNFFAEIAEVYADDVYRDHEMDDIEAAKRYFEQ